MFSSGAPAPWRADHFTPWPPYEDISPPHGNKKRPLGDLEVAEIKADLARRDELRTQLGELSSERLAQRFGVSRKAIENPIECQALLPHEVDRIAAAKRERDEIREELATLSHTAIARLHGISSERVKKIAQGRPA